ncbi:MAG: hypothetical protein HYV65_02430 [Candidatus Spechtbacteria bacterium]|nr:hypothetical protein [Candidatus Spechtbacteria bacterium]
MELLNGQEIVRAVEAIFDGTEAAEAIAAAEEILSNGADGEQRRVIGLFASSLRDAAVDWAAVSLDFWGGANPRIAVRLGRADLARAFRKEVAGERIQLLFQELAWALAEFIGTVYGESFLRAVVSLWHEDKFWQRGMPSPEVVCQRMADREGTA